MTRLLATRRRPTIADLRKTFKGRREIGHQQIFREEEEDEGWWAAIILLFLTSACKAHSISRSALGFSSSNGYIIFDSREGRTRLGRDIKASSQGDVWKQHFILDNAIISVRRRNNPRSSLRLRHRGTPQCLHKLESNGAFSDQFETPHRSRRLRSRTACY